MFLIQKCQRNKLKFLDIPLTGGRIGAETGNLTLLAGGNKQILKNIQPALKAISKKVFHFGPAGHGMRYKLILNYLQATHIIAFGQAMKIAKANKMDLKKVGEGLVDRPGGIVTQVAKDAYFRDPKEATFSIEWLTKDLSYAKRFAKNIEAPLLDIILHEFKNAIKQVHADKDWASINKIIEK